MEKTYHNLRSEKDWVKLFDHLLKQSGWWKDSSSTKYKQIQDEVFGGELINATILLLQGLTPVRIGFLDGQARAVAMYYYLLKVLPSMDGGFSPLTSMVTQAHACQHWTLLRTSEIAACHVHRCLDGNVTVEDAEELRKKSKESMEVHMSKFETLSTITPYSLSDSIGAVIRNATHLEREPDINFHDHVIKIFKFILREIRVYDSRLATKIFKKMETAAGNDVEVLFTEIYTFKGDLLFPRLKGQYKGPSPQVLVLMLVLGAMLADERNVLLIQHCMNKEWLVPITDKQQVHGAALENLHPGTFVNPSIKETWYLSKLHLVSSETSSSCLICESNNWCLSAFDPYRL